MTLLNADLSVWHQDKQMVERIARALEDDDGE